jgi:hypothetical protein
LNKKKYLQFLMLSTAVLALAQGVRGANSPVGAETTPSVVNQKQLSPKVSLKTLPKKYSNYPFKDISRSIFKNYINDIYHLGITTGYTPTTYKPENNVTRGEMAVFLWRLAGSPNYTTTSNVFTDVTNYKQQILWLSATNITNGTGNLYSPNAPVTRGQMAAFLHRLAVAGGKAGQGTYVPPVSDAKKHMFKNDIGWFYNQGITDSPNSYKPDDAVTRGEMAAFLSRFYNKFNTQADKTTLVVRNSELLVNGTWKAEDNFVKATDENGKEVGFGQVKVTGQVDTSKAGITPIIYSYNGKTATATVTVKEPTPVDKTTLLVQNSELFVNDNWKAEDNFVKATDENGNEVGFAHVKVAGQVDTSKAGITPIIYSYNGKTATATVTVKEPTPIAFTIETGKLRAGTDTATIEATLREQITGITGDNGKNLPVVQYKDQIMIKLRENTSSQEITLDEFKTDLGNITTEKAYKVIYSLGGKSPRNRDLTVDPKIKDPNVPVLSDNGKELYVKGRTWNVLQGAADAEKLGKGNRLVVLQGSLGNMKFKEGNLFFESADTQDGYNTSHVKKTIDNWYKENIAGTEFETNYVQPVVLNNPTLKDMINLTILKNYNQDQSVGNQYNWYKSHNKNYRTTVSVNGTKQAFALSTADVSNGQRYGQNGYLSPSTFLTEDAKAWQQKLKALGFTAWWLRSPGYLTNHAGAVYAQTKDVNAVYFAQINNNYTVVPAFVVSVPGAN